MNLRGRIGRERSSMIELMPQNKPDPKPMHMAAIKLFLLGISNQQTTS